MIASDLMAEVQAEVELEPDAAEKVGTVFREELERAFEQAHAAGRRSCTACGSNFPRGGPGSRRASRSS